MFFYRYNSISQFLKALLIVIFSILILGVYYFLFVMRLAKKIVIMQTGEYIWAGYSLLNHFVILGSSIGIIGIVIYKIASTLRDKKVSRKYMILDKKQKGIKNLVFYLLVIILMFIFIWGINNYNVIYKDKIIHHSIIKHFEKEYSYEYLTNVSTGFKHSKRSTSFYYYINLNDGGRINLDMAMSWDNWGIEETLIFDKAMQSKGIKREFDRKYLEVFLVDLGEEYQKPYRELFKE